MKACPTDATLERLGNNSLSGASLDAVERHVDECPTCQDKLSGMAAINAGPRRISTPPPRAVEHPPDIPGFVIERELGRGATSIVYQARQPSLNRRVALKVVRSGPTEGTLEYARWLREAKSSSRLRHENVVRLYDVGKTTGWLYLVLELIPGGTLLDGLDVAYGPGDAARLLATIAGAVAAIHGEGLLHLDLKPSNILLDRPPNTPREHAKPRVGDFGVASPWNDPDATVNMTGIAGPMGTPRYMAPEQIACDRKLIGPAADIYGLGAILYHSLTGRPPFLAPSVAALFDQIQNHEPVPPRRLDPAIPGDLETICLKCLQKDPTRRYPSAQALADDLTRWLDGRPIAARPVSALERAWRTCRRHPAVAALAASLAATLCAACIGMFFLWRHADAQRVNAEADFEITSDVLGQVVAINAEGDYLPKGADPESLIDILQQTREKLLSVARRRPGRPLISRHLAFVDKRLGYAFMLEGRWDDARTVFAESLPCWDRVVRDNPLDQQARINQILAIRGFAEVAEKQGKLGESEERLTWALRAAEAVKSSGICAGSICLVADIRNHLAHVLARRGSQEAAGLLIAANRRMLDEVTTDASHPDVMAWRLFTELDLGRWRAGGSTAVSVTNSGDGLGLAPQEFDRLAPEPWAELVARGLRSAVAPESTPTQIADAGFRFALHLGATASEQRRANKLDDAQRTAERIHALGRLLVARYPDQSFAHLALGEGFSQLHKNAWQTHDRAAIERNLKLALDESLQSLVLDPKSANARFLVHMRERRLQKLTGSR